MDVRGCPDADGDGWSDEGDAFPDDPLQWKDTDEDGYGDNPIGVNRDDCPNDNGDSTMDRQGCPDADGNGYSDEYGDWAGKTASMADNPITSVLSWSIWITLLLIGISAGVFMRRRRNS
jgi:hypothetical protein